METKINEVKHSFYAAMSIYKIIRNVNIKMDNDYISLEDKKYLSLYLGVINTDNSITNYFKEKSINIGTFINFRFLEQEEYLKIYNDDFINIFNQMNFESLEENLKFLLSKDVIKKFNKSNGYYIEKYLNKENKVLVKK